MMGVAVAHPFDWRGFMRINNKGASAGLNDRMALSPKYQRSRR